MNNNTIVVAYSGGLDTSVMVKWLHEKYQAKIITYTANLGQVEDFKMVEDKAYQTGAEHVIIDDLQDEFVNDYIKTAISGNALYEGQYPLATALGRPLIAKKLVETAHKFNANMIAHGCTGKGNDQVRLEIAIQSLDPTIQILAPLRNWELKTRAQEIDYALKHKIPISISKSSPYSYDENLWGNAIECGDIENLELEVPEDAYLFTNSIQDTPNIPQNISIEFKKGVPVALNDSPMGLKELIIKLNELGANHGIGRIDLVENRIVGIKSREIYESPAATILLKANHELEKIVLDKESFRFKNYVDQTFSNLIYDGFWFSPLTNALKGFYSESSKNMSGLIKLKLFKTTLQVVSRSSEFSLYNTDLATYSETDNFNHNAAEGFIEIYGLNQKVIASVHKNGVSV